MPNTMSEYPWPEGNYHSTLTLATLDDLSPFDDLVTDKRAKLSRTEIIHFRPFVHKHLLHIRQGKERFDLLV